jgi:bis(5'-nucleosyl)-tetraphosphatase (symmetrical)
MATYVIGDVQGCFEPLMQLLNAIAFNAAEDKLIFCGDLVNRGGRSLDVLRWIYAHQNCCEAVLGNHDLSMLSKYFEDTVKYTNKEFKAVFHAPDADILIDWLLHRPLYLELEHYLIVHAGVYPWWKLKKFKRYADETHQAMVEDPEFFFRTMYGNTPKKWTKNLTQAQHFRFVINACTRMRFVKNDRSLNFSENGKLTQIKSLQPWFKYKRINKIKPHIIFGHWSALGLYQDTNVTCIDTGKVWGGHLTALRLDDYQFIRV